LQNCSNLPAGELDDGEVVVGVVGAAPPPAVAPPVAGAAAPPCAVLGFGGVVVVCAGVVVAAVVVVVVVVSVVVVLAVGSTFGVFASPGTVSVGVVGSGSAAFLLPPPQAARTGARAIRAAAVASPWRLMV
jgi:hypothetical protein